MLVDYPGIRRPFVWLIWRKNPGRALGNHRKQRKSFFVKFAGSRQDVPPATTRTFIPESFEKSSLRKNSFDKNVNSLWLPFIGRFTFCTVSPSRLVSLSTVCGPFVLPHRRLNSRQIQLDSTEFHVFRNALCKRTTILITLGTARRLGRTDKTKPGWMKNPHCCRIAVCVAFLPHFVHLNPVVGCYVTVHVTEETTRKKPIGDRRQSFKYVNIVGFNLFFPPSFKPYQLKSAIPYLATWTSSGDS